MSLEATDLACERGGHTVFAGVSFALAPGGMLLLTGPNGAGKSSLLRLLAGLGRPARGRILIDGDDAAADPQGLAAKRVYVGHADALKPALTVAENLAFWTRLQRGATEVAEDIAHGLAAMGLAPLSDTPARYLSAGQRRRAALARAVASGAALWLLDEPTTALDAAAVAALDRTLSAHLSKGGMAVVSSHAPIGGATVTLELGGAS